MTKSLDGVLVICKAYDNERQEVHIYYEKYLNFDLEDRSLTSISASLFGSAHNIYMAVRFGNPFISLLMSNITENEIYRNRKIQS